MSPEKLLKEMTRKEKIGQLVQLYGRNVLRREPGTDKPVKDSFELTDEERSRIGSLLDYSMVDGATDGLTTFMSEEIGGKIPPICMHDVIHGCDTIFPISLGLACSFDPELMRESSRIAAEESKFHNIHTVFAPMADLARDARWGRVMESCGEDPLINSRMAAASVEGFHEGGVSCCVKHMAAYGEVESGREYNCVQIGERMLREAHFPAYKAAVDAGADLVMTSYNTVNDIPATASKMLQSDVLRGEWGFEGLVISDSGAVRELIPHGFAADKKSATKAAWLAGVDMDMSSDCYLRNIENLMDEGVISEEELDNACLKVLKLKEKAGLLNDDFKPYTLEERNGNILTVGYLNFAEKCAEASAVLLKNNGVLPISKSVKKLAVIGPFADTEEILGNWICFGAQHYNKGIIGTVKSELIKKMPDCEITFEQGCSWGLDDKTEDFTAAVQAAKNAEAVVLCIGEHQLHSGEGNSRTDITLPEAQMKLAQAVIEANPNTSVLLFTGRPLAITELDGIAPAILCMWQPGTSGNKAAVNLLLGDVNPSGKLTMSWPRAVGQCPISYRSFNTGRPCWSGDIQKKRSMTSNYIDEFTYPLYPFGHGLSYTEFKCSSAGLSDKELSDNSEIKAFVKIKNIGKRAGAEVVQLYIRDRFGSVVRPVKELKEYKKIFLAPDEEVLVEFKIDEEMLRFWRADMTYGSEKGSFVAMLGTNSRDIISFDFELK